MSECKDSKSFHDKATDNKFDEIDYFWLKNDTLTYLTFTIQYEKFEHSVSTVEDVTIDFKRVLFENPSYFKKIVIDGELIYKTV